MLRTAGFVTETAHMLTENHRSDPRAAACHRVLIDLIVTTFSGATTPDHKAGGKSLCVVLFSYIREEINCGIDSSTWLSWISLVLCQGDGPHTSHFQLAEPDER